MSTAFSLAAEPPRKVPYPPDRYKPPQDLAPGAWVNERYRIEARVGEGGMGVVLRATEVNVGRAVALKLLHTRLAENPDAVTRFRREAEIIARLRHPSTLKLIEFGALPDGQLFLATEWVDGQTLDERLRAGPLSPRQVVLLTRQVLGALAEAHEQGVVHRDLKPGNLMLEPISGSDEVVAKVLDYGIARIESANFATADGDILGTPEYMSPEQVQGEPVDARADLYSLGVVLYECLCGVPPFSAPRRMAIMYKHVQAAPPPFATHGVPPMPQLEAFVMSLLAKSPADRPSDATAARVALDQVIEALPDAAVGAEGDIADAPDTWRDREPAPTTVDFARARVSPALALLLVAAGAAGWAFWSAGPSSSPPDVEAIATADADFADAVADAAFVLDADTPDATASPAPPDARAPDAASPRPSTAAPRTAAPLRIKLRITPRRGTYQVGDRITVRGAVTRGGKPVRDARVQVRAVPASCTQVTGAKVRFTQPCRATISACHRGRCDEVAVSVTARW